MVLSLDCAQNFTHPSSPQQVGSLYFKALRKCSIFGIQNEVTHVQVSFLINEQDLPRKGKGANANISMLDKYLDEVASKTLVLFADNCLGQNKNNAMAHYLFYILYL